LSKRILIFFLSFFLIAVTAKAQRRNVTPQHWVPLIRQELEPSTPTQGLAIIYADPNGDGVWKNFDGDKTYFGGANAVYNTFSNLIDANIFYVDETNDNIGLFQTSPSTSAYVQLSDKFVVCKAFTSTGIAACVTVLGAEGGEIYLPEGIFWISAVTNITIANITIRGSGWGTILKVDPNTFADEKIFYAYNNGDNFTLRDLKVDGQETDVATDEISIDCERANVRLINCWFYDIDCGTSAGIHLGSYGIMEDCLIESCGSGSDSVVICYDDCKIINNRFVNNTEPCIYSTYDNCVISNNSFTGNTDYCIKLNSNADETTISNNNCYSNTYSNLYIPSGSIDNVVYGNLFDQGTTIVSTTDSYVPIYKFTVHGKLVYGIDNVTIAASGDGNPATHTLIPTATYVELTCSDSDNCTITMSETGAVQGQTCTITNISANVCDFADSAGVSELAGAFAMGQYDMLDLIYLSDRWVERCRANN